LGADDALVVIACGIYQMPKFLLFRLFSGAWLLRCFICRDGSEQGGCLREYL
jgi:hypothetical protein